MEDTNTDATVSVGDTVRTDSYPLDADATTFGTFQATEHTVAVVTSLTTSRVGLASTNGATFLFNGGPTTYEYYQEQAATGERVLLWDDNTFGFPGDSIQVQLGAPSDPTVAVAIGYGIDNALDDDPFIDVEFALP